MISWDQVPKKLNNLENKIFNSKILLFGEFSILNKLDALIIPFSKFCGSLAFENKIKTNESNFELSKYFKFLELNKFKNILDLDNFKSDLDRNIYFESNIPIGYGLGSSGALVAAVFDKYYIKKNNDLNENDIIKIKKIMSKMENYFHGNSSGLDPLNSYFGKSIIVKSKKINTITFQTFNSNDYSFFLIDTNIKKNTQKMVNIFKDKMKSELFSKKIFNDFNNLNKNCIESLIVNNIDMLDENFKNLSIFTFNYLNQMIPKNFIDIWSYGNQNNLFNLKLCGSGGGGYLLGFTKSLQQTKKIFKNYKLLEVF